jgi:hypothetical protein
MNIPDFDYQLDSDGVDVSKVNFDERDEVVVDKLQRAVHLAMSAREALTNAAAEAIETSSTFGYELGVLDERQRALDIIEASSGDLESAVKKIRDGK